MLYSPEIDYFYRRLLEDKIKDHVYYHGSFLPENKVNIYVSSVHDYFLSPNVAGPFKESFINDNLPDDIKKLMQDEAASIVSGLGFIYANEGYVLNQKTSRFLIINNPIHMEIVAKYREQKPDSLLTWIGDGTVDILLFEDLNSRHIYENILNEKKISYCFERRNIK